MPRFSANLGYLFAERPLLERFGAAAAAGFKAVEAHYPYDIPAKRLREEIARHALTMLAINTEPGDQARGEFGLGALAGRESDFQDAVDRALAYQAEIGGNAIHCMAGVVPAERRKAAAEVFVRNIGLAADKAARHGLTILIEPINRRSVPDYFLCRVEQAAELIAHIGRPNVKIMFDCFHVQIMQGDLIERLKAFLPLIGHVQVAGVPTRAEPDEGEIHYPAIYAALDAMGYAGWIGAEYTPRGRTEDGLAWGRAYGIGTRPRD